MNKIVFILGLSLMATGAFAENSNKTAKKEDAKKESVSQVCCRRGASNSSGENVTVRACVSSSGDYQIDMGQACEKAAKAAKLDLAALD